MRVAVDCSHYSIPGGVRTYLDNLVPALGRVCSDIEVELYVRSRSAPDQLPSFCHQRSQMTHVPGPRRWWSWIERRMEWPPVELQCGDIDVFHGTHFTLPATRRAHRVLTVHDVAYLKQPELYADRRLNDYGYRTLLTDALRRANRVLAISHHTRHDLIEVCGVEPDRVWVVPFGWDQRLRPRASAVWRPQLATLGIDRPYVVYPAGSIDVRKNLDRVLDAFRGAFPLRSTRPLLVITGLAGDREALERRLRQLELVDDVRLMRVAYPCGLEALFNGAEWGMYLSLYEGFGLPLLEMMGCGVPIVASNTTAVPEVCGGAALTVDPTDVDAIAAAFVELHESEDRRRDLRARGLSRAAGGAFGWDRAARQTIAAYRDDADAFAAQAEPLAVPADADYPTRDRLPV